MNEFKIKVLHLFPDLLNLYGDKGNIEALKKRLLWRGIDVEVISCTNENSDINLNDIDIVFVGGGTDKEQEIVCDKLREKKEEFKTFVENGGTMIALCGGFQFLGKYYQTPEKEVEGIGILDIYTETTPNGKRMIGDAVIECTGIVSKVVGFENHSGKIKIGAYEPLGRVVKGFGNDGESGFEGVQYKNVFGTFLHGPLFPKNPELCDLILHKTLKHKYPEFTELSKLDDTLENLANQYIAGRN